MTLHRLLAGLGIALLFLAVVGLQTYYQHFRASHPDENLIDLGPYVRAPEEHAPPVLTTAEKIQRVSALSAQIETLRAQVGVLDKERQHLVRELLNEVFFNTDEEYL